MRPLAILVTGEPVPFVRAARGGFDRHIRDTVGAAWPGAWRVVDARATSLPDVDELAGIVVTGSPASVTELLPWMERAAGWLGAVVQAQRPLLGLCFGHQLLGHALGGEVRRHPAGPENGTVALEVLSGIELLGPPPALPLVNMMHDDTVARLPPGAVVLARTAHEPHAAVQFGRRAWGLQFHPEFDGEIVRGYVSERRARLTAAAQDVDALLAQASDTPWSAAILRRFASLVVAFETGVLPERLATP